MTQPSSSGIPFTLSTSHQAFRLFELPPEVLTLLTTPNPPILHFKSIPPQAPTTTPSKPSSSSSTPAHAVLCTPTQTFQLRQVNTSNSLFVAQPRPFRAIFDHAHAGTEAETSEDEDDDGDGDAMPGIESVRDTVALSGIAQCSATIELLPQPVDLQKAGGYLRDVLPVWSEHDIDTNGSGAAAGAGSKAEVYRDIPLSDGEVDPAWKHLCAFEDSHSRSWIPSAKAKIGVWAGVLALDAVRDCTDTHITIMRRSVMMSGEEEYGPEELVKAVVEGLGKVNGETVVCERRELVGWVMRSVLEAEGDVLGGIVVEEYLGRCRDLVPREWEGDVRAELVEDVALRIPPSRIRYRRVGEKEETAAAEKPVAKPGKRNWHERFKQARK